MGTELRFLKQMQVEGFEDSIDSEFWHGKALELAIKFLPGDAPLVKHIVSSYQKHHSPTYEQIPEDEEINSKVRVIRPNDGIVYNKIAPVIRDIPKPSVKLAPLDLPQNMYNEKLKLFENEKSTLNISDALKESKIVKGSKEDKCASSKELVLIEQHDSTPPMSKTEKHKSAENIKSEKVKEPSKMSTEENIGQNKMTQILNNTDSLKPK